MRPSDPLLPGEEYIYGLDIQARIEYLAFTDDLDPVGDDHEHTDTAEGDRCDWEDEIEELAELRSLAAQVEGQRELSGNPMLIREDKFREYADQYADELFGLEKTGASEYFKYDEFAVDYRNNDFTDVTFGSYQYYV